jgi:WD40 repeat protein
LVGLIPVTQARPVFYSGDGRLLVVVRRDGTEARDHEVSVFRAEDLARVRRIGGVEPCAALSPDGNALALMPRGGTRIEFQDPLDGRVLASWEAGMAVGELAFSKDGALLFGRRYDGREVAAWRVDDGRRVGHRMVDHGVGVLAVGADGEWLASAGAGQTIELNRVPALESGRVLRGHEDGIHALDFSPDGRWLVSGGNDHQTRVWELAASSAPGRLPARPPREEGLSVGVPDGIWTGDGKAAGRLVLRDREGREIRRMAGPPGPYLRLVAAPDGRRLGAVNWPRELRIAEVPDGKWGMPWQLSAGTVGPVVFSPDGKWLASGGDDNLVSVRDAASGELRATLPGHRRELRSLAFTPDGRTLVSSAADGTVRLWHLPTWRELGILHDGENLRDLEFVRDGSALLATDGAGETLRFPAAP